MKRTLYLVLAMLAAWAAGSLGQSYSHYDVGKVGYVQVSGSRSGVAAWVKQDSSVFPNCPGSGATMWIETDVSMVTEASARSMLATLLTAKTLDSQSPSTTQWTEAEFAGCATLASTEAAPSKGYHNENASKAVGLDDHRVGLQ